MRAPIQRHCGIVIVLGLLLLSGCAKSARPATASIGPGTSTTSAGPVTTVPATTPSSSVGTTTTLPRSAATAPHASARAAPVVSPTSPPSTRPVPASCPTTLAGQLASTGGAGQLVTVDAPSYNSITATVTLFQRSGSCWIQAAGPWSAHIGQNGVSSNHTEGDGTTPSGSYSIGSTSYGLAPDPGVHGTYHRLVCGDWWDEDPSSPQYNTFQHVDCGVTPPFGSASEALWKQVVAYQRFAVVDYNTDPVVPGAGSGIFIHDDHGGPTVGCISLAAGDLDMLLRWLQPAQAPRVVIGSDADIRRL